MATNTRSYANTTHARTGKTYVELFDIWLTTHKELSTVTANRRWGVLRPAVVVQYLRRHYDVNVFCLMKKPRGSTGNPYGFYRILGGSFKAWEAAGHDIKSDELPDPLVLRRFLRDSK